MSRKKTGMDLGLVEIGTKEDKITKLKELPEDVIKVPVPLVFMKNKKTFTKRVLAKTKL